MDSFEQRQLLELALRYDFATFIHRAFQTVSPAQPYVHNWHVEAIAWHLVQCARGELKRLLITLPPRYLKSICASVAYPAWLLGLDPTRPIVTVSYSEELAGKHARDCRAVMESGWYKEVFPRTRIGREKNRELDFVTTRKGGRYAASIGGTLTGRGGKFIIVDDPIKPVDAMSDIKRAAVNEWFDRTIYTRLDDKRRDVIIVIMQRLHLDDLAGHLLAKDEEWAQLSIPAIANLDEEIPIGRDRVYVRRAGEVLHEVRESRADLERIKKELGTFNFSAQYQQSPIPIEGEIIKLSWFQIYEEVPMREVGDRIVQSWDTASTAEELANYSVCTTWLVRGDAYYLIDVFREQLTYPDLKRAVLAQYRKFQASVVLIENKGSGISLIQDLRQERASDRLYAIACTPEGDKVTRMSTQSAKIEAGQVYLPRRAKWLEEFRRELLQFPRGRYDDEVDSLSQFLEWTEKQRRLRNISAEWVGPDWRAEPNAR